MEPGLLATAREFISGYWPHVSGGAVAVAATVGTAIFAYIRRPKSSPTEAGPYFTEAALLSPPLTRPAYSDRMAYVLAEMSNLAYYQFEGRRGFVDDAVENAMSLDLTDDTNVHEFLETFSTELMSGRRLQLGSMKKVLSNSGFSLLDVIDINETQGFACKRIAENEPPYLVLAFRGTEKKISDWLTDARCVPTVEGKSKVHSGFLDAFAVKKDADGKTVKDAVEDILRSRRGQGREWRAATPVHYRSFAGRCPGIARNEAGGTGREWGLLYVRCPKGRQLRVRIPVQPDHRIRRKSITDSDSTRSLIPAEADHRFRCQADHFSAMTGIVHGVRSEGARGAG